MIKQTHFRKCLRGVSGVLALSLACAVPLKGQDLPPDSTEALGQKFADRKAPDTLRVLLAGSGGSHDFPRYFAKADADTLKAAGGLEVVATLNLEEALELLPEADVLVFSGNHEQWGFGNFQKALNKFADSRKGIVILHAGTWIHPWPDYNKRFVAGGSTGHGFGEIEVTVKKPDHPIMKGVPETFKIVDESYHHRFGERVKVEVLAENGPDDKTKEPHASVWIVEDRRAKIVNITHGHAAEAHSNPAYQTILINAVKWAGGSR